MRRCKHCRCLFEICTKVKKHEYCNKKECQRARKRKWQRENLQNDSTYRIDQNTANEDWADNNPHYWKNYRKDHPKYTDQNREKQHHRNRKRKKKSVFRAKSTPIAKMDALQAESKIISGKYKLVPFEPGMIAKMDALIVEIASVSNSYTKSGP
jgi:hypothetical protein